MSGRSDPGGTRWSRLEAICVGALDVPAAERAGWLIEACDGDPELLREASSLLGAHDPDFLSEPLLRVRELPSDDVDATIAGYRIVRPLGRGGMGDVYLAVRTADDYERPVALKLIRKGLDTDDVVTRFRQERRILSTLSHPNIATLLDGGRTADGRPFFVMEHVDGVDLTAYVRSRTLDARQRITLFLQIAAAVAYAHRSLVVHRDLKPANILVTDDGTVKLLDFGIARILDDGGGETDAGPLTRVGQQIMTLEYAAPEQITGAPVTTTTDVYALGVILFELLAGTLPWTATDRDALRDEILAGSPPAPSRVARQTGAGRDVDGDLDVIVLKALSEEPMRRYTSPAALVEDLQRYLEGRPILARPSTWRYRTRKFVRRRPWAAATAAAAVAALLSSAAIPWVAAQRAEAEREKALEVQAFLLEMFGATGGDRATGDTLTARGLLDRQAALVPRVYDDDPDLMARMERVLGEGYERLGLFTEAEAHASAALELERSHDGLSPDGLAASLNLLGWIRHQLGADDEAAVLLEESVEIRRDLGRRYAAGLSRSLNDLGVVRDAQGDYSRSAQLHEEAFELRREEGGLTSRATAESASNLAVAHYRAGDFEPSAEYAGVALEALRRTLGPDHQRSIIAQNNLAAIRVAAGDLQGAGEAYAELLERQTRLQGRDHPVTVGLMVSLATTHILLEDGAAAEALMREARQIENARSSSDDVRTAGILHLLGRALVLEERYEEGVAELNTALALRRDALGPDHRAVAETTAALAEAWERAGRPDEALAWQERALRAYETSFGPDHPQTEVQRSRLERLAGG